MARWRLKCHEGAGSVRFKVLSYSQSENVSSAYFPLRIILTPQGLTGAIQPQLEIAAVTRAVPLALNVL